MAPSAHWLVSRLALNWHNGLGAARGQRSRKGSCASYPTRYFLQSLPATRSTPPPTHGTSLFNERQPGCIPYLGFATMVLQTKGLSPWRAPSLKLIVTFRRHSALILGLLVSALVSAQAGTPAAAFRPKTMDAFATYVRATDARNISELQTGRDLLWIDTLSQPARDRAYKSLAEGEVQIEQRTTRENDRLIPCPGGLIHHWEGLVFIPGVHVDDVLQILQDYDHHSSYYAPDVAQSRLESRDGQNFRVFLRFRRQKVITVVLNTEHDVHYFRDGPDRARSRSSATHIGEVHNAGKSNEREKPREEDGGFLWGMETWWRLQERDGGVYVQSEVVSLTRDIPVGLGWMIGPFVTSIPKDTLTFTLEATRKAVLAQKRPGPSNGS